jgi:RpiB/LacA/LacB family sugar-phosphate isomerase
MRIAIGSDHLGLSLKTDLIAALEGDGHVVLDLGPFSAEPVDYPDYARVVGQAVLRGFADRGVLVCGSGVGAAMAANKIRGVRAAPCADVDTARESREEQDANVLCLPARALDVDTAIEVARTWVDAAFSADEARARQVGKLGQLESAGDKDTARPAAPAAAPRPPSARRPAAPAAGPAPPAHESDVPSAPAASAPRPPGAVSASAPEEAVPSAAEPALSRAPEHVAASAPPAASTAPAPGPPRAAPPAPVAVPTATADGAPPAAMARTLRDPLESPLVAEKLAFLESQDFLDRLWVKDASLWRGDAAAVRNRLGWLTMPAVMRSHVEELRVFADEVRRLQHSQVVLLGPGAPGLTAELFNAAFGSKMGFPDLLVLDSTDPAAVKELFDRIAIGRALFLAAAKSGATPALRALYACARARLEGAAQKPGMQFIALTDPGSSLERLAAGAGFRRTFLDSPAVAGGYSALSFTGLLPAALIGVDIKVLLERAQAMVEACGTGGVRDSPALRLGAALAGLAQAGRDKVTFVLSEAVRALGPWLELLLAESLGKDGRGPVPVVDEPLGAPAVYGPDRVFAALVLDGDTSLDGGLEALDQAGHPVIRIGLRDPLDIGGELFRWQMAAATAAAVLGVNPFDTPDADLAAERIAALLAGWRRTGRIPEWPAEAAEDGVEIVTRGTARPGSVGEGLAHHLAQADADDYVVVQAYLPPTREAWSRLQALRVLIRDRLRIATTVGFGPQYLSSSGQLHKGGRPGAVVIQIVSEGKDDLAIPGEEYGLSVLKAAQAQGDLEALRDAGRRVIRLRLTGKPAEGLAQLLQIARTATRRL